MKGVWLLECFLFARLYLVSILSFVTGTSNAYSNHEVIMKKFVAAVVSSLYLAVPVLAADDSHMDNASEAASEAWEKTKEASSETWEATKDTSSDAVDATKEGTEKAWDATKDGTEKAWDATKDGTEKAWDATKEGVDKAVEGTKKAVGAE
jgi:hypothetical protein